MTLALLVAIVAVSLLASFSCSISEAALYAVRPSLVETMRRRGLRGAVRLTRLRQTIEESIAAILILNTVAHTMGAVWGGAVVEEAYGATWVFWFSIAFTLAILFFTEIIPKSLGVAHAGLLSRLVAWPIQVTIWVFWPLVQVSEWLSRLITRGRRQAPPGEEEVIVMADLAEEAGQLLAEEERWVANALRLNNRTVRELMTPLRMVESLPADITVEEAHHQQVLHSRLPLTEGGDRSRVMGLVYRRDIYERLAAGDDRTKLRALQRKATIVPEKMPANELLQLLLRNRQHLAVVADRRGRVCGVVSVEDVLEYMLGREIADEYDIEKDMEKTARGGSKPSSEPKGSS